MVGYLHLWSFRVLETFISCYTQFGSGADILKKFGRVDAPHVKGVLGGAGAASTHQARTPMCVQKSGKENKHETFQRNTDLGSLGLQVYFLQ